MTLHNASLQNPSPHNPSRPTVTRPSPPSFAASTWLVAQREVVMRLRSKSFLISTGILLLAVLASVVIGGITSANAAGDVPKVAAVGSAANSLSEVGFDVTQADSLDEAEDLVRNGDVDAAVVAAAESSSPLGLRVIALDSAPTEIVQALSVAPEVELLEPPTRNAGLVYLVALGFGLIFFMSAITFGSTIAQSVVEEKQTRVVEILLSSIPAQALLAGKVIGNSLLAFGQIAIIALLSGVGLLVSGQSAVLGLLGPSLIAFVVFFAIGFVLLAALFAAAASLVSRPEDMGAVTTPVTMLVMIPYFLVIFFNDNALVLGIMSYVPFSAPVGMPMRIFLGTAEWWEPILSLVILVATTLAAIWLGSRVYSNSLLRMGGRVKLRDALESR